MYRVGDILVYEVDGSRYEVICSEGPMFYKLRFIPDDKHPTCILRIAGTKIEYVNKHFRKLTKLELALK